VQDAALETLVDELWIARVGHGSADRSTPHLEVQQPEDVRIGGSSHLRRHGSKECATEIHLVAAERIGCGGAHEIEDGGGVRRVAHPGRRGKTLVAVSTVDRADQASAVLHRFGAYDVLTYEPITEAAAHAG
jgi:hypothetical protein